MANPKILGSLTLIVLLIAMYVAFQNKKAYENEIAQTKVEDQNLKISQARLKRLQKELEDMIKLKEGVQAEVAALTTEEENQKKLNFELKGELDDKTAKATALQGSPEEMDEKRKMLARMQEVVTQLKALKEEITNLDAVIKDNEAEEARLISANTNMEGQIKAMIEDTAMRTSGKSLISLKTSIRSVYPTWGFVTLNGGDKAGVVLNSTLAVVRDDEVVCKLFVTTVERDSASANIVPDSIDPGVVLMVGDRVVPIETKQPKEAAPAPGTETKIPGAPGAGGAAPAGDSLEGLLNSLSQ